MFKKIRCHHFLLYIQILHNQQNNPPINSYSFLKPAYKYTYKRFLQVNKTIFHPPSTNNIRMYNLQKGKKKKDKINAVSRDRHFTNSDTHTQLEVHIYYKKAHHPQNIILPIRLSTICLWCCFFFLDCGLSVELDKTKYK